MKVSARLIAVTQPVIEIPNKTSEGVIAYCSRVSNPSNQENPDCAKLFSTFMTQGHWSTMEMANAVVEVEAPRDITRQLLRHRSFSFQEFSQRYSDEIEFTQRDFRRQDTRNRQNSTDDLETHTLTYAKKVQVLVRDTLQDWYKTLRDHDVAKECARVILPEGLTMSKLYVNGTVRSWLHYLDVRDDPTTQYEHRLLAQEIRKVLGPAFPTIFGVKND